MKNKVCDSSSASGVSGAKSQTRIVVVRTKKKRATNMAEYALTLDQRKIPASYESKQQGK
jgi:hypothetical protein